MKSESRSEQAAVMLKSGVMVASLCLFSVPSRAAVPAPGDKFELSGWSLSVPVDSDNDGKADQIKEKTLAAGYRNSDFFTLSDAGGMVFKAPLAGAKTSKNTTYTRSELREMLRKGDTSIATQGVSRNNWVLSSAPLSEQKKAGGVDGTLEATLSVDHVTTTGVNWQVGRVIIGQIHANNDEPIRLYYRKLPHHQKGSVYFAHEPRKGFGDEQWYEMIGTLQPSHGNQAAAPTEPEAGIALGETFSYRINATGNKLTVTLMREGRPDVVKTVDMSKSGYSEAGQYLYFKAGVYNQNKTGKPDDYVQATFYRLKATHGAQR
ncbi:Alginate lyase [Enterobacterales bacterium 8AC]|nr:Alginate lyase [Enterobacterales bacterium 8AC]